MGLLRTVGSDQLTVDILKEQTMYQHLKMAAGVIGRTVESMEGLQPMGSRDGSQETSHTPAQVRTDTLAPSGCKRYYDSCTPKGLGELRHPIYIICLV